MEAGNCETTAATSDSLHNCHEASSPAASIALALASATRKSIERLLGVSVTISFLICVTGFSIGSFLYHLRRRKQLKQELRVAQDKLHFLQEKLNSDDASSGNTKKEIRIFMEGAFDLLHFGHMNAFRLGRSLGTHLVVGVNSDESIAECKAAPLMNDEERLTMVGSCKFVDEVIPRTPYVMNSEYLKWVIDTYNIDYVVHGDDPCFVDGKDVYAEAKALGKFKTIPRTCGVSTTDIVGRMLLLTKDHHYHEQQQEGNGRPDIMTTGSSSALQQDGSSSSSTTEHHPLPSGSSSSRSLLRSSSSPSRTLGRSRVVQEQLVVGQQSKFLTTSRMLQLFSAGVKAPADGTRVIYIDGAWDLFHPGHVETLKAARERGDYLIVGIHGDPLINQVQGMNLPLMNLHERVLSVLGCRYASDVLIDAPYEITDEMVSSLGIDEVVRSRPSPDMNGQTVLEESRFRHAKAAGILHVMDVDNSFEISKIIQRIQRNQEAFQTRFERKMNSERQYYAQTTGQS